MVSEACDMFNLMPGGGLGIVIGAKNKDEYFKGNEKYADEDTMVGKKAINFQPLIVEYMGVHDSYLLIGKKKRKLFDRLVLKYPSL